MTDIREAILARLLAILGTIEGVAGSGTDKAVGRNIEDIPARLLVRRPAIILHDGAEQFLAAGDQRMRAGFVPPQRMELTPLIVILAGAEAQNVGTLLSLFRARLLAAVMADSELVGLIGTNGKIHFAGDQVLPPGPESREGRMELTFVFTYVLNFADLA